MSRQPTTLALDLGTRTGWCFGTVDSHISGTWNLTPGRFSSSAMRFIHFREQLESIRKSGSVDRVVFEEVRKHIGTDAAHIYGGFLATLSTWCEEHDIPYEGVPIGTIKLHWAGRGNAPKDRMIAVARERGYEPIDDNEADALALFDLKAKAAVLAPVRKADAA